MHFAKHEIVFSVDRFKTTVVSFSELVEKQIRNAIQKMHSAVMRDACSCNAFHYGPFLHYRTNFFILDEEKSIEKVQTVARLLTVSPMAYPSNSKLSPSNSSVQ